MEFNRTLSTLHLLLVAATINTKTKNKKTKLNEYKKGKTNQQPTNNLGIAQRQSLVPRLFS